MVLDQSAVDTELSCKKECPKLSVVYNQKQDVETPLSKKFLDRFDQWITDAKKRGRKILFRDKEGIEMTGRLSAYYQMKYQNLTYDDAVFLMYEHSGMSFFAQRDNLLHQVKALEDYIHSRPCSTKLKYCVREE